MKIGDTVRLRNRKRRAQIVEVLPDIKGGVKLDRPLDGFRYWNKNDLVKIDRRSVRVTDAQEKVSVKRTSGNRNC